MSLKPYSVLTVYYSTDGGPATRYDFVYAESPADAARCALKLLRDEYEVEDDEELEHLLSPFVDLVLPGHIVGLDPESKEQY